MRIKILLLFSISISTIFASSNIYQIESGDTFYGIVKEQVKKCNGTFKSIKDEIIKLNRDKLDTNLSKIRVGQKILIPSCKNSSQTNDTHKKVVKSKKEVTKETKSYISFNGCDANAKKLIAVYPQIVGCKRNHIIWSDGTKMLYNDTKSKRDFNYLLNHADIEDMFRYSYLNGPYSNPPRNYDPGRIRNDAFFKKMYGSSSREVRRHLRTINWFGRRLRVTTINGIDRKLQTIERELRALGPRYAKYLTPPGGTFNWRKIAGTTRLSVHSFGAAIDINTKYSNYWRWSRGRYQNKIPLKIVKIFERHGFIWGGKWYHYDTMHFEYRPELLVR